MNLILMQCLTLLYALMSLDINLAELRAFSHIENAVGVHNITISERTPLSTQITTWYILLDKGKEDSTTIGNGCPDNSTICAVTKADLNHGGDPIVTGIFSVDENYSKMFPLSKVDSVNYGVYLKWKEQVWGDLMVDVIFVMRCAYADSFDPRESLSLSNAFAGVINEHNTILWISKLFCNVIDNIRDVIDQEDNGWGLFSTLVLAVVIALAGFLPGFLQVK